MDASVTGRRPRRGFTLIEMLAVIVIIGILASLLTAAALSVVRRAKVARINLEIDQLDMALKQYKNLYGDYPPADFSDKAAVRRHLARAFPRYDASQWESDLGGFANMKAGNALVFWLGGIPKQSGDGWIMTGFSADLRRPFATDGSRKPVLFEFKQERLAMDENGVLAYYPDAGVTAGPEACPYYYTKPPVGNSPPRLYNLGDRGKVSPYFNKLTKMWVNKDSFQIICAGLDNHFGGGNQFPTGDNYQRETFDNITNFADGTLEDEVP